MNSPVPTLTTQPSIYSPQPVYHPNVRSPSLHSQTLSDYGSTNKSPSLLGPPLTRDHSAVTSNSTADYLPTPTDETIHVPPPLARNETSLTTYYRNQAFPERFERHAQAGRARNGEDVDAAKERSRLAPAESGPSTRARANVQAFPTVGRQIVPLGQNTIPGNGSPLVVAPRMVQQRSARELISQYEEFDSPRVAPPIPPVASNSQMASGPRPRSVSTVSLSPRRNALLPPLPSSNSMSPGLSQGQSDPPRAPPSHCLPESPSYFSTFARRRGKMRNSFTNLIQLIGDKTKDNLKNRNSVSPSTSRSFNALPKGFKLKLGKRPSPLSSPGKTKDEEKASVLPDINELLKTEPGLSALLLYQSPARQGNPDSTNATLWMPYDVSLYPASIILQVPNPGLSSSSRFQIPLSDLFDAHSVLTKDLPLGTIPPWGSLKLPPGFRDEMYVFEVHCYGGRVERFATPSMAVRTKWVGYLLDVLVGKNPQTRKDRATKPHVEPLAAASSQGSTPRPSTAPSPVRPLSSSANLAPSPAAWMRSRATSTTLASSGSSASTPIKPVSGSKERPVSSPAPLMTPTTAPSRIRDTRPISSASRNASVFPNPWDSTAPSVTNPRGSSFLMSPRSDRSGMTASPSISRLDERNLVRNRLAMFERQASPTPSRTGGGSFRGKEGSVNWEALSEVRSGRGGSGFSSPGPSLISSRGRVGGLSSPGPTAMSANGGSSSSSLFKPRWPFPESSVSGKTDIARLNDLTSELNSPLPEPSIFFGPRSPLSGDEPSGTLRQSGRGPVTTLFPHLTNRPVEPRPTTTPKPIQVLGDLPLNKATRSIPSPVETAIPDSSLNLVLERLASLTTTLRESDVAHSTKASGLGQLIASTQDHILQAVEESTKSSSREHVVTTGYLERLQESVRSLVDRPPRDAEERAELLAVKETLERIDKTVSERLEDLSGERGRTEREEIKGAMVEHIEGLKQTVQDLALKVDNASAQSNVLAKLDALAEGISTDSGAPTLDPSMMEGFVQQIKDHVSSLQAPTLDAPPMDTSEVMMKLDSIATAVANVPLQVDLSNIQKALEEMRELSQDRQDPDAPSNSVTAQVDLSDVLAKLDGISTMCLSFTGAKADSQTDSDDTEGVKQATQGKLLAALREDAEHRTTQAQQTSELVRYSNELNAWLEKFVMNASTQMDSVGSGLGALRRDLGLDPPLPTEGQTDASPPPQGVLQELREMFVEQVKAAGDITASLNALLLAFNEEQTRNAEARQNLATDTVLKMIDVQRQEQEQLLRKLATGDDIRGERIRFVEAMSQATSMNVQLHVEEFKKQLTHEVLALTDEVGRLREERKTIQHQIAQLFLVKSEHEVELGASGPPPRPIPSTRPIPKQ